MRSLKEIWLKRHKYGDQCDVQWGDFLKNAALTIAALLLLIVLFNGGCGWYMIFQGNGGDIIAPNKILTGWELFIGITRAVGVGFDAIITIFLVGWAIREWPVEICAFYKAWKNN